MVGLHSIKQEAKMECVALCNDCDWSGNTHQAALAHVRANGHTVELEKQTSIQMIPQ